MSQSEGLDEGAGLVLPAIENQLTEMERLPVALANQGTVIGRHEQALQQTLAQAIQQSQAPVPPTVPAPVPSAMVLSSSLHANPDRECSDRGASAVGSMRLSVQT
ncbi:hypothetical protein SKAU_G00134430 [Synaphobranchus kaupii]|uniref:Uncharacterized protein n=1 Tax=Synaphobranchus kaupii TaxID=118154 RepID=A0A9Q1FR53_SYNKA|nr:hypothetical protein SKAU_G00134430 [Synaphobranchus kaupii]